MALIKIYEPVKTGYKSIKDMNEDEQPRERLINHGSHSLSDSELVAILLGTGTKNFSALDAAKALLEHCGGIVGLSSFDFNYFKKIRGIGETKAIKLAAAIELGKRIEVEPFNNKRKINSPDEIAKIFIPRLKTAKKEFFYVILLNTANQIIREIKVSEGILNSSIVHPREVFKEAIIESAAAMILLHNHPSGNPQPSKEDLFITKQLVESGNILDIKVLDHLIIAGEEFTSFVKLGLI